MLEVRDELSSTKDSSHAVINLIRAVGDIKLLYQFGYKHPELIKQFFYNLDGSSTFGDIELTHKTVFATIFMTVCKYNGFSGFENVEMPTFRIGDGFYLDNHIRPERDKFPDKYSLTQQQVVQQRELITAGHDGQWYENMPRTIDIGETGYYHPFHPVYYIDQTSKEKTPVLVPALFVKAIAHQQKVAEIMTLVRVLADVLALVIGVVSLGSGSVLYVMLGALDIGIAAKDLHVISQQDELMKTAEGREYLENWNRVALIGSIPTALVLGGSLIGRTFNLGARLLSSATVAVTKNFLRAGLLSLLLEINIANFTKNTVKVLDAVEVSLIPELRVSLAEANKLYDAGVVLVKGDVQVGNKVTEEIAVAYNAEVIANGKAKDVRKGLKNLLTKDDVALEKELNFLEQTAKYESGRIGYIEGLFDGIDITHKPRGFEFIDKISESALYGREALTTFSGSEGYFIRNFDKIKKAFTFNHAFLEDLPKWVDDVKIPLVEGRGIPTQTYFTLRQMKLLGIGKGEIRVVKMAQIQNLETMGYIYKAMKEKGLTKLTDVDILAAPSNEYMKTVMTQAGYETNFGKIVSNNKTTQVTVKQLKQGGFSINKEYLQKFGLTENSKLYMNFDIEVNVKYIGK